MLLLAGLAVVEGSDVAMAEFDNRGFRVERCPSCTNKLGTEENGWQGMDAAECLDGKPEGCGKDYCVDCIDEHERKCREES